MATYDGTPDDDVLLGGDDDDILNGLDGDDTLEGGPGNDFLEGGFGADMLDGGEDHGLVLGSRSTTLDDVWGDTVGYELSDAGVTVNLATGAAAGGHAEGDTLTGIESVRGSDHADILTARDRDPNTEGIFGDGSTLWGQKGDDVLRGGTSFDALWGGEGDDTLEGGGSLDYLEGGPGADVIDGGPDDHPYYDAAGYELSDAGVTVNLAMGTGRGGDAEGDTLTRINMLWGSQHGDHLVGDAALNLLQGRAGNDTLEGGAGDDQLQGGAGADMLDGGEGRDRVFYGGTRDGSDAGVTVDLATGTATGGHAEGDTLTGFEDLWGSSHADHLSGDAGSNVVNGWEGDDTLAGGAGDDTVSGGAGDDVLEGGAGADVIDGGEDEGLPPPSRSLRTSIWGDTATYVHSDAGVTIDLSMGTAQGGHAEGDTLTGIESVRGSDHADMLVARNDDPATEEGLAEGSTLYGQRGDDTLSGGTGQDRLWGGKGDDVLMGGAAFDVLEGGLGADVIDGGDGNDYAGYELSDAGVTIDLSTGTAAGGHAEGDTLTGIEFVFGSSHADRLTGDAGLNALLGGPGADMLDGGEGYDYAFYNTSDAGVTVNLATGTGQGGDAEGDTLTGIEAVFGSDHADRLIGDDAPNILTGLDGNDTLEGGAGGDWHLQGGAGADLIDGGAGFDFAVYGTSDAAVTVNLATGTGLGGHAEGDTLTGVEAIYGSHHDDHLTGDDGDNILLGAEGDDTLDGGAGFDAVNYYDSDAGVTVNLATDTAAGGYAEGDTLSGIERVIGSSHPDDLSGDAGSNRLRGLAWKIHNGPRPRWRHKSLRVLKRCCLQTFLAQRRLFRDEPDDTTDCSVPGSVRQAARGHLRPRAGEFGWRGRVAQGGRAGVWPGQGVRPLSGG